MTATTMGAGNSGGRWKQRQWRGQTTINQRGAAIAAAEMATVAATEMVAVAAAATAAMLAPTVAEAAADAATVEVECDMNQRVGVSEEGSTLTQILDFHGFWRQKSNDLVSVYL